MPLDPAGLNGPAFAGLLEDWRSKVAKRSAEGPAKSLSTRPEVEKMSVAQLLGALKPAQLWSILVALAGVVGGAFALGVKLGG
jgi:hypothetical protein